MTSRPRTYNLQEPEFEVFWSDLTSQAFEDLQAKNGSSKCQVCHECELLAWQLAQHRRNVHQNVFGPDEQFAYHIDIPVQRVCCTYHKNGVCENGDEDLTQHLILDHSVIKLADDDPESAVIEKYFKGQWMVGPPEAGSESLRVDSIFKLDIFANGGAERFERYKEKLVAKRANVDFGKVSLAFHGTTFACDIDGKTQGWKLCKNSQVPCHVCGIIEHGLQLNQAKQPKTSFRRYGKGIYSTRVSSKSDNYVKQSRYYRAIFVCKVLLGYPYITQNSIMEHLDAPPEGFDSVWAIPGRGLHHLNYDEYVVYDSDAILPTHIIIYHKQLEFDRYHSENYKLNVVSILGMNSCASYPHEFINSIDEFN